MTKSSFLGELSL